LPIKEGRRSVHLDGKSQEAIREIEAESCVWMEGWAHTGEVIRETRLVLITGRSTSFITYGVVSELPPWVASFGWDLELFWRVEAEDGSASSSAHPFLTRFLKCMAAICFTPENWGLGEAMRERTIMG